MSFKRVCLFLMFEVVVAIPIGLMIYWLLSLHTDHFQGDKMRLYLHGIVMMFAFTYTLGQGIALLRLCPGTRGCAKITHSIFNTLSLLFGIAGLILIVSYKSAYNKSHLYSLHSWCGLLLLLLMIIQFIGGSTVLQSCCQGASLKSRLNYTPNHVATGIAVLLLAAVCIVSGVINLKEYLKLPKSSGTGLDFENSLLNLMAASSVLVFIIILCAGISRRTRKGLGAAASAAKAIDSVLVNNVLVNHAGLELYNVRGGKIKYQEDRAGKMTSPQRISSLHNDSKASLKSKPVSVDTAYSSGPGSAQRPSQKSRDQRRPSRDRASSEQFIGSPPPQPYPPRRDSGPREGSVQSPPIRSEDPMSPGRMSFRSARDHRSGSYQDNRNNANGPVTSPSLQGARQPPPPADGRSPPPYTRPGPHPDHSYQVPYHDPRDTLPNQSLHGNGPTTLDRSGSSPDVPPLFEVSHLRASRRGVPPPLDQTPASPPPQFAPVRPCSPQVAPVGVVNPYPSQFSGQVGVHVDPKLGYQPQQPGTGDRYQPQQPGTGDRYQPQQPGTGDRYSLNGYPDDQDLDDFSLGSYSPQQQPTTFGSRSLSRHQIARQHRYEARRAKVNQANLQLQQPVTPPPSSYTESLGPSRVCASPTALSPQNSVHEVDSSVLLSEDVDGAAPRRGRTSYRNAVREEEHPPPVPPPPQEFEMTKSLSREDDGICWL